MTHLSVDRKDLLFVVQVIQGLIFFVAHFFISVLIGRVFVVVDQEQLWWLQ